MIFKENSVEPVKGAATVSRLCLRCNNQTDHILCDQPTGLMLTVPIIGMFMKRPLASTSRAYFLGCPICQELTQVSKDIAEGLIRKGSTQ